MNADWRSMPMAAVMAEFYDGPHATPPPADDGPVYLGIKNMTEDGHLDLSDIRHISEDDYGTWTRRVEPRAGDVVFTYEASLHRYAIIPEGFRGTLGRRVALLRPRPEVVDTRFLLYAFISRQWRETVEARLNIGSTVDRLPLVDFPKFPITLPPLRTQRKIAAIFSAYDDQIENNSRRIRLLEEMAQRIYREWFVDFRYPGHEDGRLIKSELGLIPEGWVACCLGDLVSNFDRLRKPLSGLERVKRPGVFPYYGAAQIFDFIDDYLFDGTYLLVAEDGSVITREGFPVLQYVTGKFWANNHTHVLQGRSASTEYIYVLLRELPITGYVTGAAQPKITQANLNRIPALLPTARILNAFDNLVQPILSLVQVLKRASLNLGPARDLLLPRLISGAIDVEALNIAPPDVV